MMMQEEMMQELMTEMKSEKGKEISKTGGLAVGSLFLTTAVLLGGADLLAIATLWCR